MRKKGRLLMVASLIAGLMAIAGPARAEGVEYVVEGEVLLSTHIFEQGDPVTVWYSVDPDTPDSNTRDESEGLYLNALLSLEMTIGDHYFRTATDSRTGVIGVSNTTSSDSYAFTSGDLDAPSTFGLDPGSLRLRLEDGDGESLLAGDSLAQPIEGLQRLIEVDKGFSVDRGSLPVSTRDGFAQVEFSVDSIEILIVDSDNDGVPDTDDVCTDTDIPDPVIPTSGDLGVNRYALTDGDTIFDTTTAENHEIVYTLADTGGCNATQIADALGLGKSHYEKGITRSVLESWIAGLNG